MTVPGVAPGLSFSFFSQKRKNNACNPNALSLYEAPDGLLVAPTPRYHPKEQRPFLGDPGEARG